MEGVSSPYPTSSGNRSEATLEQETFSFLGINCMRKCYRIVLDNQEEVTKAVTLPYCMHGLLSERNHVDSWQLNAPSASCRRESFIASFFASPIHSGKACNVTHDWLFKYL